jgi:hypothetical protein
VICEISGRKLVPLTLMFIGVDPASADVGVNPEIVGTGFNTFTVKVAVPPPGAGFTMNPLNVRALCV